MTRIFKYTLKTQDSQILHLPEGAKILSVGWQHNQIQLWAEVDQESPTTRRLIHIYGTGHPILNKAEYRTFLGTVDTGRLIWHLFEVFPETE